jgi:SAM-dependent methyltransferase
MNDRSQPQLELAVKKNQEFFANNDEYKSVQSELEHYKLLALTATEAVRNAVHLLDIGNGGIFVYPVAPFKRVVAVDIFVEPDFSQRYPSVEWVEASALNLPFKEEFDTAIEINTLHHIVGGTVRENYQNLQLFFEQAHKVLIPGGRLVLIESTVPKWFLIPYNIVFPLFTHIWPLKHPPTYQFHFRDLETAAYRNGFKLQEFSWIPKCGPILAFGKKVPGWLSPAQVAKFIFTKA